MNQNEQQILARALFCHAAHSGSLSEAARVLGVDRGSVRNLIRSLESEVGESLLTRSTAGVKPTAAGKRLYSLWSPAVAALENAAEAAGTSERARINVSLPTTTGTTLLMPVIGRYAEAHPELQIDVRFTHGSFHPLWDGVDLRVGHGEYWLEDVKTYRLGAVRRIAVASPDYLKTHGSIRFPKDLLNHPVFGARDAVEKKEVILTREGKREALQFDPQVIVRNHMASLAAALAGLGKQRLTSKRLEGSCRRARGAWCWTPDPGVPRETVSRVRETRAAAPRVEDALSPAPRLYRERGRVTASRRVDR